MKLVIYLKLLIAFLLVVGCQNYETSASNQSLRSNYRHLIGKKIILQTPCYVVDGGNEHTRFRE